MAKYHLISDEKIKQAVSNSQSYYQAMTALGMPDAGGSRTHLRKRIDELELDVSHFTGQGHLFGTTSAKKHSPETILVLRPEGSRKETSARLRRALLESGVPYICAGPGCPTAVTPIWENITLEIDHKNGNNIDNRKENLWFLCPNCHAQQPTSAHAPWKNTARNPIKTKCGCGAKKRHDAKTCLACYNRKRKPV